MSIPNNPNVGVINGTGSWFGGSGDPMNGYSVAGNFGWSEPLIATYNSATLNGYWRVTAPNGRTAVVRQGDIGPNAKGRVIDIGFNALGLFGYNQSNFPTDQGRWTATYLGKNLPPGVSRGATSGGQTAQNQAMGGGATPGNSYGTSMKIDTGPQQKLGVFPKVPDFTGQDKAGQKALKQYGLAPLKPPKSGITVTKPKFPAVGAGTNQQIAATTDPTTGGTGYLGGNGAGLGTLNISPGANRPGVPLTPLIMQVGRTIAGAWGQPLTVGTGSNHNQMTTSGNVSDHWNGNAVDIPASGNQLTRLGQTALRAMGYKGAPPSGGVFNLQWQGHRVQILFNTNVGGNHFNHLHVGVR